jgi:hypothetical protein
MALEHSTLSDPNLHEPKGVSTAQSGKVYVADGAGSGGWVYPGSYLYGELYIGGGATSLTLNAVADTYIAYNPTAEWTANGSNGVTLNATNGTITATTAGTYKVEFWTTFTTASLASGIKYKFKYAVNGTVDTNRALVVQKNTAGSDVLTCSASGIVTLAANDILSVYIAGDATSANTAVTPIDAGFIATLLKVS